MNAPKLTTPEAQREMGEGRSVHRYEKHAMRCQDDRYSIGRESRLHRP